MPQKFNDIYISARRGYNGCLSHFHALGNNLRKCDFFDVTPMGKWLRHFPCGFSASLIVFCEVFFVQFFTDGLMNIQTLYVTLDRTAVSTVLQEVQQRQFFQILIYCLCKRHWRNVNFRVCFKTMPDKNQTFHNFDKTYTV